jgi:undecaprenyl-diphosphatase
VILVAGWACGKASSLAPLRLGQQHLWRAVAVGAMFTGITYVTPWASTLAGGRFDPVVRLRGWQELGREVGRSVAALPDAERTLIIVHRSRSVTSELAFYMPGQPRVYLWNPRRDITSQYDLWGGPRDADGSSAAILTQHNEDLPRELRNAFQQVVAVGDIRVAIGNAREHHLRLWHATNMIHWPGQPALVSR